MVKLVYFGNKLSKHGGSKSVMETLEPLFEEFCQVRSYSGVKNQYLRLLDMIYGFFATGLRSDLIIIDVYSTKNFYFAWLLSILSGFFKQPYVLFLHGGNLPERYLHSRKKVDFMFKRAKKIVAPSGYLKSFFEEKGYSVSLIPNLIDIKKFPFQMRDFANPALIYVRGFGKIYNPLMTVKAIKSLRNKYPQVSLVMLGNNTDDLYNEVQQLIINEDLHTNIKIMGKMSQAEWIRLSGGYNIMLSNPLIDNAPVSIIEGMALGLIIISTKVGGIVSLLKDKEDAFLVDSNDHEGMANTIMEILENKSLALKMRESARAKAESFSWEYIKPLWEDLLVNSGKRDAN